MDDELVICMKCMAANPASAAICSSCGSSLGGQNNLDPMTSVYSQARVLTKGVDRPTKPIVLIMIWVIFLPWLLIALLGTLQTFFMPGTSGFLFFWMFVGNVVLASVALFKVTNNYRRTKRL